LSSCSNPYRAFELLDVQAGDWTPGCQYFHVLEKSPVKLTTRIFPEDVAADGVSPYREHSVANGQIFAHQTVFLLVKHARSRLVEKQARKLSFLSSSAALLSISKALLTPSHRYSFLGHLKLPEADFKKPAILAFTLFAEEFFSESSDERS
jgi:hypothetical protein